jgi:PqqD family protein of HPr-rel-A system
VEAQSLWHAPKWHSLPRQTWEGEVFVYNLDTGNTHVLNAMSVSILERLAYSPASMGELSAHLGEEGSRALVMHLKQLEELCLVERLSS